MANVLKLKRSTTELSFIAGVGNGLRGQVWYPQIGDAVYGRTPEYVTEQMDLMADRTSDDDLATTLQALDQMRWWADMAWRDRTVQHPVWLHAKMDGESGERRTHVRSISGNWRSNQIDTTGPAKDHDALLRLQIERHPYWEDTSATEQDLGWSQAASMMFDYGSVSGDVPARIGEMMVHPEYDGENIEKLWTGIRSDKDGRTPANFQNIWELEDPDVGIGTDLSAPQADSSASPGSGNTRREVTFATEAGWALRLYISITDVTSDIADQVGRFLWLLCARTDNGTTAEVYLKFDTRVKTPVVGPTVEINSGTLPYQFYEMGEYQVPAISMQLLNEESASGHPARTFQIELWARRTAGSGSLYLDCLCPIPIDEGWLVMEELYRIQHTHFCFFMQLPNDETLAYTSISLTTGADRYPPYSCHNFALPPGSGSIVIATHGSQLSPQGCALGFQKLNHYHRWLNLRGSE